MNVIQNLEGSAHMERPDYVALDAQGAEVKRKAMVIGDLPHQDRGPACVEAAAFIAQQLGMNAPERIHFGTPVFTAFKLTRPQAKNHEQAKLLLTHGHEVSLGYCPRYN